MKRRGQWGMSKLFRQNSKMFAFLTNIGVKKWWKPSQQAAELKKSPSISATTLAFPSLL